MVYENAVLGGGHALLVAMLAGPASGGEGFVLNLWHVLSGGSACLSWFSRQLLHLFPHWPGASRSLALIGLFL